MRHARHLVLALVLLVGIGVAYAATIQTSTVKLTGLPNIYVTSQGPSGSTVVVSSDPKGGSNKKALVHKVTISGTDRLYLIRIQNTSRGIYLDVISDVSTAALTTTVLNLNLTTPSHPAPAKDSTDAEAMVAAGGELIHVGLVDGTAIVTAAEVAEITHEDGLANLDGSNATIANACKWATTVLIDELDARGIPCDKIANPARLKRAAAYFAAAHALRGGMPDQASQERAAGYDRTARELLSRYRFVSSDAPDVGTSNLLLPSVGNMDECSRFGPDSSLPSPLL